MGAFRRSGTFGIVGLFVVAGASEGDWLCDLWLAERLADALAV
ncbi:MAG TPA: hypothetical protein VFS37_08230 [Conexibacter sp.]|nr:hypothetical protein [Conexibacter sp.]